MLSSCLDDSSDVDVIVSVTQTRDNRKSPTDHVPAQWCSGPFDTGCQEHPAEGRAGECTSCELQIAGFGHNRLACNRLSPADKRQPDLPAAVMWPDCDRYKVQSVAQLCATGLESSSCSTGSQGGTCHCSLTQNRCKSSGVMLTTDHREERSQTTASLRPC